MSDPMMKTGAHRFEAEVSATGWGSRLIVDGRELPTVAAFRIGATVEKATLEIEIAPEGVTAVQGFVDAVTWLGTAFLACDFTGKPLAVFWDQDGAFGYLRDKGISDGTIAEVPFEVTR